ncbi:hypothetical protein BGW80DRAFT_1467541 [Lactifluus volemus]|nr:hypothetical protein BGW80DRAFT_1467541 [Lactifluus volemus]
MEYYSLEQLLDLEAVVADDDEDEEEGEEDLEEFLADDLDESDAGLAEGPAFLPDDRVSATEASELEARARDFMTDYRRGYLREGDQLPQHSLVPTLSDPHIWAVRVKIGYEMSLVFQIYRRWNLGSVDLDITSVFARDGIPGYIFLEGGYADVQRAISKLVTVIPNSRQRLVTLEQRVALLNSRNPMSRAIKEGEWVRVKYGLYRDDVGFVCGRCDSSDLDIIVALIPRIATKSERRRGGHIGKRKRPIRPAARPWSETELVHEWGPEKVQNISPDAFTFRNETYESRLLMARYSSSLLDIINHSPSTFPVFAAASSIGERHSFVLWRHRNAQASLQPRQRVKVESGEQQGLVGFINEIIEDSASIIPEEGDTLQVMPHVLLSDLAPHYLPGDNVKARWMDSHGIVQSVNDADQNSDTTDKLVDYDSQGPSGILRTSASADSEVQPRKRRGIITQMIDNTARIRDERTSADFMIDAQELNVCAIQASSLPKDNLDYTIIGQRVMITRGPFKSYYGLVKEIGLPHVTVELDSHLVSRSSPRQNVPWKDIMTVYVSMFLFWSTISLTCRSAEIRLPTEPARPPSPSRPITPPSGPSVDLQRLTPEPEGPQRDHWLFYPSIHTILQTKRIPFTVSGVDSNKDLVKYKNKTARSVPERQWDSQPGEWQVIVSIFIGNRIKQISIDPKYLVPWNPKQGGEVVVINSHCQLFGNSGTIIGKKDDDLFTVLFGSTRMSLELNLPSTDLVVLETLR